MTVAPDQPGELSADGLLDKPAGRNGPVVVRDAHFFTGASRLRFWGVNIAFSANFPAHAQADKLAFRFARYGINAVRFHHMDNQPFPNGIFADASLTALSPEALDRLDYFLAALKSQGVYADINLHVSRNYNHYHKTTDGKDGPHIDKMVDIFDPELIAAQQQYARDLLTHTNAYTHLRYADDPAVGIVEINNENSLFMWGADQTLLELPTVYHDELSRQWNRWLIGKYTTLEKLKAAWDVGAEKFGDSILADGDFTNPAKPVWHQEKQGTAAMKVTFDRAANIEVTAIDGTDWHLQLNQSGLHLKQGSRYTASFEAKVDRPMKIGLAVSQAHAPWASDGLGVTVKLNPNQHAYSFAFTVSQDDDNARLTFIVGQQIGKIIVSKVQLNSGGGQGLTANENPTNGTVQTPGGQIAEGVARSQDWYNFLQQTEENYYVGMMNFLKTDMGVKCPITGTIGFGPSGTLSQSKMDFVDAHAYWEHPSFPHKQWDAADWIISNHPMVDHPDKATLWNLAATRVAGKPFTITEYQHPAPNDWQAECIPMIATYAALQDWDGVFLFAYSHNSEYEKDKISSFFDIEGNPAKMPLMPMGARLFNTIKPDDTNHRVISITHQQSLEGVPQFSLNPAGFLHGLAGIDLKDSPEVPTAISYTGASQSTRVINNRVTWTATTSGTGRFIFTDTNAAVFVGFAGGAMPINLGNTKVEIESLETPFATLVITPDNPKQTLTNASKLLITAIARTQNSNMQWNADRTSISTHWGIAPTQIEVVHASINLPGKWLHAMALDPDGKPVGPELAEVHGDHTLVRLGTAPAIAYEISRAD